MARILYTITNTIYAGTLEDALAHLDAQYAERRISYVQRIGYEVERDGERITLYPAHDQIGVGARPGDDVEVTTLGLGSRARVLRVAKGYPRGWTID